MLLKNHRSSGNDVKVTPVPIPNTMVKLYSADGTARETVWKSRSLLGSKKTLSIILSVFCVFCIKFITTCKYSYK